MGETNGTADGSTPHVRTWLAQLEPTLGNVSANLSAALDVLERARVNDADLVVFPELYLTGYHVDEVDDPDLLTGAAAALETLCAETDDLVCVMGAPVVEEGEVYNSAVVADSGERRGTYHKVHLYGSEAETFVPGDDFPTFETSVGTVGVEICYDLEFPESARQLAMNGADLLVTISANMRPFELDQLAYHRARGMENVVPHALCNRVGEECGVDFFGESGIVDHRGRTVMSAGADVSTIVVGELETGGEPAETLQYYRDRRPETYGRETPVGTRDHDR